MRAFREVKVIGKGSFGEAIMVQRRSDKAAFVVKKVPLTGLPEKERAEAANEVAVLDALQHPHIVRYFEAFEERGCLHIVLEFADSGDLAQQIAAQKKRADGAPFGEAQLLRWFAQTASALQYVHSLSMLHRDIKTANIFLTRGRRQAHEAGEPRLVVKLGDFGIAKQLADQQQMAQTVIGTPYYMSPELCEDLPYDQKSDVWALGCVLYELAMLRHAFDALNLGALVRKIMASEYIPLPVALDPPPAAAFPGGGSRGMGANARRPPAGRGAGGGFSPALGQLVALMLAQDPVDRPALDSVLRLPLVAPHAPCFEAGGAGGSDALAQTRAGGFRAPRSLDATVAAPRSSRRTDMGQTRQQQPAKKKGGGAGAGSSPSMPGAAGRAKAQRRHSSLEGTVATHAAAARTSPGAAAAAAAAAGAAGAAGATRRQSFRRGQSPAVSGGSGGVAAPSPRRRASLMSPSAGGGGGGGSGGGSSAASPAAVAAVLLSPSVSTGPFGAVGSVVEALRRGKWLLSTIEGSGGGTFSLTTLEGPGAPASASGVPRRALRVPDAAARARLAALAPQTPALQEEAGMAATGASGGSTRQHSNLAPLSDTDEDEAAAAAGGGGGMGATAVSPHARPQMDATAPRATPRLAAMGATQPPRQQGAGGFRGGGGGGMLDLDATIALDATIRTPKGGAGASGGGGWRGGGGRF